MSELRTIALFLDSELSLIFKLRMTAILTYPSKGSCYFFPLFLLKKFLKNRS